MSFFTAASVTVGVLAATLGTVHAASLTPSKVDPGSLQVEELASGLAHPWALAFLPDGDMLITEKSGQLRVLPKGGKPSEPVSGLPEIAARGQGGLLDVVLSPDFAKDRLIYLSFSEQDSEGMGTAVGRGRLSDDKQALTDFEIIFRQTPKLSSGNHFGSRMVFDRDGYLFVTLGENNARSAAQDLDKLQGKVVRLNADGSIPSDNPFIKQADALDAIWTYGQRNPQGLAMNPATGVIWSSEHGPRGGDEVNTVEPGKNYGWPLATHGINYSGAKIPEAKGKSVDGTEPPLYVWEASPAISGMAFSVGKTYPQWDQSLFIGALKSQDVIRLQLDGDKFVAEERLLGDRGERVRDVRIGPDDALYVLTDESKGKLLRVTPR